MTNPVFQMIQIKVKFFAVLRDATGAAEVSLQIPDQGSVDDALQRLIVIYPAIARHVDRVATAVNLAYVGRDYRLASGDELALLPPVSGG
ncbi:MAG: MoaD/ThiS family protein [Burkholderiales bacterium]|nr:MoaD/ThiS family protein [Phycisphaerae bacterium]